VSESSKLIDELKTELKRQNLTYRDLAKRLDLSEASVKRLFSEESFSLGRFAQACEAIGTSIGTMAKAVYNAQNADEAHLTLEQEEYLASDSLAFSAFHMLLLGASAEKIKIKLALDPPKLNRILIALDKIRVIDLHPENIVRLRTPRLIKWNNDGPLMHKYWKKIHAAYFKDGFVGQFTFNRFLTGLISERTASAIQERLQKLTTEIEDMWEWDLKSKSETERKNFGVLLSSKLWDW